MVILDDEAQVEARFSPFGDSANLNARQVHALRKRTTGPEIILDAPDVTTMCLGSCGISFRSILRRC
jgi:hypothetical protein